MSVWVPILLLLILMEIWWFGIHCTTYLSDIRDALKQPANADDDEPSDVDG